MLCGGSFFLNKYNVHTMNTQFFSSVAVNTVISTDVQCTDADNNQLTYNLVMSPPGSTFGVTDFGHVFLKGIFFLFCFFSSEN